MTENQVVQIAAAFLREKRSVTLPVMSVRFRPASEALHPHLARDCWFVSFDLRKPGDRFVQDPCTITVEVDASSGEPSFFGDL
jgi:hypothetical protein